MIDVTRRRVCVAPS